MDLKNLKTFTDKLCDKDIAMFHHCLRKEWSRLHDYEDSIKRSFKPHEEPTRTFNNNVHLLDDDVLITHEYLWDIICMPNDKLFPNGINLVVFEIPEDDLTGNVEIICPTNRYSKVLFSDKRLTFMLVKRNSFFEPIYLYDNLKDLAVLSFEFLFFFGFLFIFFFVCDFKKSLYPPKNNETLPLVSK